MTDTADEDVMKLATRLATTSDFIERRDAIACALTTDRAASAARVERLERALAIALNALDGLSYIHDGNPSDAMADTPPLDYARHMLFEARQVAREKASEARATLEVPR